MTQSSQFILAGVDGWQKLALEGVTLLLQYCRHYDAESETYWVECINLPGIFAESKTLDGLDAAMRSASISFIICELEDYIDGEIVSSTFDSFEIPKMIYALPESQTPQYA